MVFHGEAFLPEAKDLCGGFNEGCFDDEILLKYYTTN